MARGDKDLSGLQGISGVTVSGVVSESAIYNINNRQIKLGGAITINSRNDYISESLSFSSNCAFPHIETLSSCNVRI